MKKAFTLIELVFVIVVVAILSVSLLPSLKKDSLREAATQVISHIRYVQHLALVDDKFNSNDDTWYRKRWELVFSTANSSLSYFIFSDSQSNGNPDASNSNDVEVAKDPLNKSLYLIGTEYQSFYGDSSAYINKKLDLQETYGIHHIKISGGSSSTSKRILFDFLGRPYQGTTKSSSSAVINSPVDKIMKNDLYIKFCKNACIGAADEKNDNEIIIKIEKETGYASIL